jgi:putative transferase (TIGR04331 family)
MKKLILGVLPPNYSPETHIPLGPFCFFNHEQIFSDWENIKFEQDPVSSKEILKFFDELTTAYSRKVLVEIAEYLNKINKVEYSLRFWKIIAFPWLLSFVQCVFERQKRIMNILERYSKSSLEVDLLLDNIEWNFRDNYDFQINGIMNPLFNEWLFSRMLESNTPNSWKINYVDKSHEYKITKKNKTLKGKVKHSINKLLAIISPFQPGYGFTKIEKMIFNVILYIKYFIYPSAYGKDDISNQDEYHDMNIEWKFEFKSLLYATIPSALRELNYIHRDINKYKLSNVSVISVQSVYDSFTIMPRLAFSSTNYGTKIIGMQHGGHTYGTAYSDCTSEEMEYRLDHFITWGWRRHGDHKGNFIDLPSPMLSKIRNTHCQKNDHLVFVGTGVRLYTQRFQSAPQPNQQIAYLKEKQHFLHNLESNIYSSVYYRNNPISPIFFDDLKYIKQHFPDIKILKGQLDNRLLKSKLLVLDHPGTTFNKAFAANIPTIAYWDDEHWPMCEEADALFKLLKDCGILYKNGEQAASKVNEIWNDIGGWWHGTQIQNVREMWSNKYARTSKNWRSEWVKMLWNL